MGVASQGIVAFWVLSHRLRRKLRYIGFDGQGKQVRDVLHVDDLADLLVKQLARPNVWDGRAYNVGGGRDVSISLRELTAVCEQVTGHHMTIDSVPTTSDVDVRILILDASLASAEFDWSPRRTPVQIVEHIDRWVSENEQILGRIL
jgi:CDP-paratose 2-epimerase